MQRPPAILELVGDEAQVPEIDANASAEHRMPPAALSREDAKDLVDAMFKLMIVPQQRMER